MQHQRWYAGIDLGGTNVRAVAVDPSGRTEEPLTEPVQQHTDEPFAQLVHLLERLVTTRGGKTPVAVGIGATGPVDPVRGVVDNPFTLPACLQGDVRAAFARTTDLPVVLENDADSAAAGEAWLGAGRDADVLACLTVGTGIGSAVLHTGRVVRGAAGSHPEAGHHVVDPAGPLCYCGAHGCVESLSSATAVLDAARSVGAVGPDATARDVHEAAAAGDLACLQIVERARRAIVLAVRNLVAVHGADRVVLAGGALGNAALLQAQAQAAVDAFTLGPPDGSRVVLAQLGGLAGAVGAARLAMLAVPVEAATPAR